MTASALRRRGRPNDLKGILPFGNLSADERKVYDLRRSEKKYNSLPVSVELVDPYGDVVVVDRERRNDPLADMRSRHEIGESDYGAGRYWQDAHENSQIGSMRGVDPTREYVDGGRPPEILSDRQRKGASDVHAAAVELGVFGNTLLYDVLADGLSLAAAAARRGMTSERDRLFLGRRFRECLATLAVLFGFATRTKSATKR